MSNGKELSVLFLALFLVLAACAEDDPSSCSNPPVLDMVSIGHVTDCSIQDGAVEVLGSGGRKPHRYSMNGIDFQSHGLFPGLSAGDYSVMVKDGYGCSDTLVVSVLNLASDLAADVTVSPDNGCVSPAGAITVQGVHGTPPYYYSLNSAAFSDDNDITGLQEGIYSVRVKDADECIFEISVVVPKAPTLVSWSDDIHPIITTRCAKSGCHDGNSGKVKLTTYEDVYLHRSSVRSRVASGSMPYDGPLQPDQRSEILCWIDDGALNN